MMAQPRPLRIPAFPSLHRGLVLWLPFDERSGVKAFDRSGKTNHGTLNLPTWKAGKRGGALSFDGIDDKITVTHKSSLAVTGDITIAFWIYPTSSDEGIIIDKSIGGYANPYYVYLVSNSLRVRLYRGNGSSESSVLATNGCTINKWNHVAVTQKGTVVAHYLNGAANGTGSITLTPSDGGGTLYIGCFENAFLFYTGLLCDMRLYNRALSSAEIARLFEGGLLSLRM